MATVEQRTALLAITCPWCKAAPGEFCTRPNGTTRRDTEDGVRRADRLPVSTLDGGCHDARWQAAGLGTAPVLTAVVERLHDHVVRPAGRPAAPERDLVPVGGLFDGQRPW